MRKENTIITNNHIWPYLTYSLFCNVTNAGNTNNYDKKIIILLTEIKVNL